MIDKYFPFYVFIFFITLAITVIASRLLIPLLKLGAKQPIYEDGPKWHLAKSGTPTMGGISFLIAILISLSLASIYLFVKGEAKASLSLITALIYAVLNAAIGIIDDKRKLKRKENGGLTPTEKILLQSAIAILFLSVRYLLIGNEAILCFSFGEVDIGWLYYPLAFIILIGITNCANLTDGIDGLASGVAFAIGVSFFYISCALSPEVAFASAAIMGATIGFLIFNIHPAKVFMGDTGSLMLGSLTAAMAIMLGNPLCILVIGGVYCIEGASVIIQVLVYKLTKKRVFKMAPIHHHLEKCGWSENKICVVAMIVTLLLALPVYAFYLP